MKWWREQDNIPHQDPRGHQQKQPQQKKQLFGDAYVGNLKHLFITFGYWRTKQNKMTSSSSSSSPSPESFHSLNDWQLYNCFVFLSSLNVWEQNIQPNWPTDRWQPDWPRDGRTLLLFKTVSPTITFNHHNILSHIIGPDKTNEYDHDDDDDADQQGKNKKSVRISRSRKDELDRNQNGWDGTSEECA